MDPIRFITDGNEHMRFPAGPPPPEPTPAEKEKLIEDWIARKRRGGGCTHGAWVDTETSALGMTQKHEPFVGMTNDDDPYYVQYFRTREEVDAFIKELEQARDEAWPKGNP